MSIFKGKALSRRALPRHVRYGRSVLRRGVLIASVVSVVVAAVRVTPGAFASAHAKKKTVLTVVVSTRKVGKLGTILVNNKGRTLYMFVPDKRKKVTCTHTCAVAWPPLKLPAGRKPIAKMAAKSKLLGSDRNPAGGRVVTYHGWPLYTWVGDRTPGQATGQALDANGGLWYVLSPSGKVIRTKPAMTTPVPAPVVPSPTTTTTAAPSPSPPTTTTTSGASPDGCPNGETIQQNDQATGSPGDRDADDSGGPTDSDGCL